MNDLAELERRIMTALHHMERGLEQLGKPAAPGGKEAALAEALASEQQMTAQLTERVRAIREKQDTSVASLEQRLAEAVAQVNRTSAELERQKSLTAQLQESLRELTDDSAGSGAVDALRAELEALKAARAADLAEMDEILAALEPLIAEAANA